MRCLYYWWEPDTTFLSLKGKQITYCPHDAAAFGRGDVTSTAKGVSIDTWTWWLLSVGSGRQELFINFWSPKFLLKHLFREVSHVYISPILFFGGSMVVWRCCWWRAAKDKYVSYDLELLAPFVLELVRAFQISMAAAWLLQISSDFFLGENWMHQFTCQFAKRETCSFTNSPRFEW